MLRPEDFAARLDAARTAARLAGESLMTHYAARDRLVIEEKGRNDFVSNADREAEEKILAHLTPLFPEDGYLGEETGASGRAGPGPVWCIDPLDGTSNFLKGAHNWCVSIGLYLDGAPVLGVILDPVRGELFETAPGHPTRCNGSPVRVSAVRDPGSASVGLGYVPRVPVATFIADTANLLAEGYSFRQVGAGALMLAYVAAGRVDAYHERHMWAWDAVAGLALITGAGGLIRPYGGAGLAAGGDVTAATPGLYPGLMARLDGMAPA